MSASAEAAESAAVSGESGSTEKSLAPARVLGVLPRLSVHRKLVGIAWIGAAVTCLVGVLAFVALDRVNEATRRASDAAEVAGVSARERQILQDIRATVFESLSSTFVPSRDGVQLRRSMTAALDRFRDTQRELAARLTIHGISQTPAELPGGSAFAQQADAIAQERSRGVVVPRSEVVAFETLAGQIAAQTDSTRALLGELARTASADAARVELRARIELLAAVALAILLLFAVCSLLARSILHRLKEMRDIARRMTGGDLDARIAVRGDDELATLGSAFNETADSMKALLARLEAESRKDGFTRELADALEMADTEADVHEVAQRAMSHIAPGTPMELLLADSSRAHLERAAASTEAPAPDCPVDQPYGCIAVRRAHAVVFPTSEALSACPKLRARGGDGISACCVPVSFMGRSLGVLHATGAPGREWSAEEVDQLRSLATLTGSRIGTVRSVERTQLQAATDGLTGLLNRRSVETRVRRLRTGRTPFTLVLADLDHFKRLNDTYGHEAGDRALKMFAEVLRRQLRDDDVTGRLGGEEFVLVLPETPVESAQALLERLRVSLAEAVLGRPPGFTASFGVAASTSGSSFEEVLAVADAALYRAKDEGRDRIVAAGPAEEATAQLRLRSREDESSSTAMHGAPRRPAAPALLRAVGDDEAALDVLS